MLEVERGLTIDLTTARAWARDVATTINYKGMQHPAFAWGSHNVAAVAALLDTLPVPSADWVDMVYYQLKDILGIMTTEQVESSLRHRAEVSISILSRSKAGRDNFLTGSDFVPCPVESFIEAFDTPDVLSGPLGG
jgi:hypothetical protein